MARSNNVVDTVGTLSLADPRPPSDLDARYEEAEAGPTAIPADPSPEEGQTLVLPLEIVELILSYTFLPNSPLTPSSDPNHLHGTTHVLLVSRAIRQLALPFFFHTVVISRPSHYTDFFDPEHGIFNFGEEGRRRWELVHELGLVLGVKPPVALHVALPRVKDFFKPINIPVRSSVPSLCILHTRDYADDLGSDRDLDALIALAQTDADSRRRIEQDIFNEYEDDPNPSDCSFENWVLEQYGQALFAEIDDRIAEPIWAGAREDRERVFQTLVQHTRPAELHWAAHELLYHRMGVLDANLAGTTLVVWPPLGALLDRPVGELIATIGAGEFQLGVTRIRLEGLSDATLDELAQSLPGLAFIPLETDEEGPISRATWSWTRSDGTTVSLSPPTTTDDELAGQVF